jgi:hypothetical protein
LETYSLPTLTKPTPPTPNPKETYPGVVAVREVAKEKEEVKDRRDRPASLPLWISYVQS